MTEHGSLPCPSLPICVPQIGDGESDAPPNLDGLPARAGVVVLEDARGTTIAIATTADMRRLIRTRLAPSDPKAEPSRRVNYRALTRGVRAVPVGTRFEADWAYLQLARQRLPRTYQHLADRWQSWFVHVDAEEPFPRLVKTRQPHTYPSGGGGGGSLLGPMPDKHGAQLFIEQLQAAHDLCREHHLLVQAPHASACAYKEMGRCPAPCDGSISMDAYRQSMRAAIADGAGIPAALEHLQQDMQTAAAATDYERADQLRRRLEALTPIHKPRFEFVQPIEQFRFLHIGPGEKKDTTRVLLIVGGWIEPSVDVPSTITKPAVHALVDALQMRLTQLTPPRSEAATQNMGLVCWHLFRRKKDRRPSEGRLLHIPANIDPAALLRALRPRPRKGDTPESAESLIDDTFLEGA